MKEFWHPRLIDILDIVFPILVLCLDNRVDLRIFVNGFFPFLFMDASLTFLHLFLLCK
jgi:small basic protein